MATEFPQVTSKVVTPADATKAVKAHKGIIHTQVNMIHDMIDVTISKAEANRLLKLAEVGEVNVHLVGFEDLLTLTFVEWPVDES